MFWLEKTSGERELLPHVHTEIEAVELARRVYPDDDDPEQWVVKYEADGNQDYFLVPGGPDGTDEFTWVPRDMFEDPPFVGGVYVW